MAETDILRRLPAEWEKQKAVLLCWPHKATDWAPYLKRTQKVFLEIVKNILHFEDVILVVPDIGEIKKIRGKIGDPKNRLFCYPAPSNDTWARDFGPVTVFNYDKGVCVSAFLLDFSFNGWGMKFPADKDNLITRKLHKLGAFGKISLKTLSFILEGGSIESDGNETIMATTKCLMSPKRNPYLTRKQIENKFKELLGAKRILWLEKGCLEGDDTDSHIDTLARFAPNNTILYVACDKKDDPHYKELKLMEEELRSFRTTNGNLYKLLPLPWPKAKYDEEGSRLPATYANFLIINKAVLVPAYHDKKDRAAMKTIQKAFPKRKIIGIDCLPLIYQHGSVHCVTMQIPEFAPLNS